MIARVLAAVVGLALLLAGLVPLIGATRGITVETTSVAGTPVTVHRPAKPRAAPAGPAIVIAHGFAGSRPLMAPIAITLAHAGYIAVSYDLLGHGRNPYPLTGDITTEAGASARLLAELGRVIAFARGLSGAERVGLVGHSMASDIVVRAGLADPGVAATVAISMFSPAVTAAGPPNLLVITGDWEGGLKPEALRVLALAAGRDVPAGETVGDPGAGTGRRAVFAPSVEHVGVLFSATALREMRAWLDASLSHTTPPNAPVEARGAAIGAVVLGWILLAWPLARALPRLVPGRPPGGWSVAQAAAIVLPAIATPLLLHGLDIGVLPVLVGDRLAAQFLVYGTLMALTGAVLLPRPRIRAPLRALVVAGAVAGYALALLYLPLDRFAASLSLTEARAPLFLALAAALLPYFLADGWVAAGHGAPRGAGIASRTAFLASLIAAIALDPERLFFLLIILPVMLIYFALFGLLATWVRHRTGTPVPAAIANTLLFAWAIAATFPRIGTG